MMSKVNRSTYQKVVEENKRLLNDIKILVGEGIPTAEKILCIGKWRDKFKLEKQFDDMLRNYAKRYIKENPDEFPKFITDKLNNDN